MQRDQFHDGIYNLRVQKKKEKKYSKQKQPANANHKKVVLYY